MVVDIIQPTILAVLHFLDELFFCVEFLFCHVLLHFVYCLLFACLAFFVELVPHLIGIFFLWSIVQIAILVHSPASIDTEVVFLPFLLGLSTPLLFGSLGNTDTCKVIQLDSHCYWFIVNAYCEWFSIAKA